MAVLLKSLRRFLAENARMASKVQLLNRKQFSYDAPRARLCSRSWAHQAIRAPGLIAEKQVVCTNDIQKILFIGVQETAMTRSVLLK
jgi:hypothetical protein